MTDCDRRAIGALGQPRYLVLGMDPGIASCGFALLDLNNHEILEMGSRLFDAPQDDKTKVSLASQRRGARSVRRNTDRTQERLERCLELLQDYGVVPGEATKEYFHTVKGDKPPLRLRVDGLDRLLTDREWALVLYSLCKQRGYIPHGEGKSDGDSDDGKVLKAIRENTEAFEAAGCRTVGEWLSTQQRSRNRAGSYDLCVAHGQLVDEIRKLFEAQRENGSESASFELEEAYLAIVDWEKPRDAFDEITYEKVGSCVYFPDEKRAARCTLSSELVAAYGALGNLTVRRAGGGEETLSKQRIDAYVDLLFSPVPVKGNKPCKLTYGRIRKDLDLAAYDQFKGVKSDDEKKREPYAPKAWRALREALAGQAGGEELLRRLRGEIDLADAVMEAAAYSSSAAVLDKRLGLLDLTEQERTLLVEGLPYSSKAFNGYGTRSKIALDLLLDAFVDPDVRTLTQAEDATGLGEKRRDDAGIVRGGQLPPYDEWLAATGRTNNNPVVLRAMAQMRKVVNAVCREWGVPDEIHVELDRELRLPKKVKQNNEKSQKANRETNERNAAELAQKLGCAPDEVKGGLLEAYRFWKDQGGFDPYTGEPIYLDRMLENERYAEIDHILPFSRTGDNARSNKVLVLGMSNQNKKERTPCEWMHSGEPGAPDWDAFAARVRADEHLRDRKQANLLEEDLESKEAGFLQRSITDTAYMSREVCAYLADCLAFPADGLKAHVVPTKGQATALLRRAWGLNFGLGDTKDRGDDRHHATDACVIAACSRSLVIKTAHYSSGKKRMTDEERDAALAQAQPWEGFAADVRAAREHVVPTRSVQRKGTGQAFEATLYSYVEVGSGGRLVLQTRKDGVWKKTDPKANAVLQEDGKSARLVGDMVCLRLWHDPLARPKGKVKGQWYADPIYVADLPALRAGTYVPRIAKVQTARSCWKPIPAHVLEGKPVEIYLKDVVQVGDHIGRFAGFGIAVANWTFVDPVTRNRIDFPSITRGLGNEPDQTPRVIREDVLGHCWRDFPFDEEAK